MTSKTVLVTGSNGFVGRNLCAYLEHNLNCRVLKIDRTTEVPEIRSSLKESDVVVHLAGVNRPLNEDAFLIDNVEFTKQLTSWMAEVNPQPLFLSSSIQATAMNSYGQSKKTAEDIVFKYGELSGCNVSVVRFPNIFGKWSRANYNSVVATFIDCVIGSKPLTIDDPDRLVHLVYIDDVCRLIGEFVLDPSRRQEIDQEQVTTITLSQLADLIRNIHSTRVRGQVLDVGSGFLRALYATYIGALSPEDSVYPLSPIEDSRGSFTELIKTRSAGQISVFTAKPGVVRGSHFHQTKTEIFIVLNGKAKVITEAIHDKRSYSIELEASQRVAFQTIPGWAHKIQNIGTDELVVMVWANEVFDPDFPDTFRWTNWHEQD